MKRRDDDNSGKDTEKPGLYSGRKSSMEDTKEREREDPRDEGKDEGKEEWDGKVPPVPYTPWPFPLPDYRIHGKGDDDHPVYTPYLFLNHEDPNVPGSPFWLSPDIWVTSSLGINQPEEGKPNQIFARVHNAGLMDALNVNVRFYWADPSAAITDANVTPIGGDPAAATATGVYIPSPAGPGQDSAVMVQCPVDWFPEKIAHQCLLVKAWAPGIDPNTPPYEPVLDPINDRHSAQRNTNVVLLPPGAEMQMVVKILNISRFAQEARIVVRALPGELALAQARAMQIKGAAEFRPGRLPLPVKAELSEEAMFLRHEAETFARLMQAKEAQDPAKEPGEPVIVIDTALKAFEQRDLHFQAVIPGNDAAGSVYAFDIAQYLGGLRTGGYTAMLIVG
ncbi:MAG: hypothetical protein AAFY38_10025 [Pseudomonadota bacterium]